MTPEPTFITAKDLKRIRTSLDIYKLAIDRYDATPEIHLSPWWHVWKKKREAMDVCANFNALKDLALTGNSLISEDLPKCIETIQSLLEDNREFLSIMHDFCAATPETMSDVQHDALLVLADCYQNPALDPPPERKKRKASK